LDEVTKAKAELDTLTEQAASLHKQISADKSSGASGVDARELTEKAEKYNELVNEISAKRRAALRLVSSYNQSVERYNTCINN
jgi:capsule polysaccharide export protein KpsE/RkpR